MQPPSVFSRFKPLGAGLLLFSAAVIVVPCALGQQGSVSGGDPSTSGGGSSGGPPPVEENLDPAAPLGTPTKVGYGSIADGSWSGGDFAFKTFSSGAVIVIPFKFTSLGDYTLTSASLLLKPDENNISLSDLSLVVYDTLPPDSTSLPTAVTSFASTDVAPGNTLGIHTFTATSSPTLEAGKTYYLGATYFGTHTLAWNLTTQDPTGSGPVVVGDTYEDGTTFSYYLLTASGGGTTQLIDQVGGFSITAAAISAVPEPATTTALAAGAVLTAALWVRWRRRHAGQIGEERPPQS